MTPFVIDANAIHAFQQERIREAPGLAHDAIEAIFSAHCIALDVEKLCYQEWIDCAGGTFPFALIDWISDNLVAGKINFFEMAPNSCKRQLTNLGLPQKDHKWIRLSIGCAGRRLVTEDIDFFDPTKKTAKSHVKAQLKADRSGACAKGLRKDFDVSVMCLDHVKSEVLLAP